MNRVTDVVGKEIFYQVPISVWDKIFSFLPFIDSLCLFSCAFSCHKLRKAVQYHLTSWDPILRKDLFYAQFHPCKNSSELYRCIADQRLLTILCIPPKHLEPALGFLSYLAYFVGSELLIDYFLALQNSTIFDHRPTSFPILRREIEKNSDFVLVGSTFSNTAFVNITCAEWIENTFLIALQLNKKVEMDSIVASIIAIRVTERGSSLLYPSLFENELKKWVEPLNQDEIMVTTMGHTDNHQENQEEENQENEEGYGSHHVNLMHVGTGCIRNNNNIISLQELISQLFVAAAMSGSIDFWIDMYTFIRDTIAPFPIIFSENTKMSILHRALGSPRCTPVFIEFVYRVTQSKPSDIQYNMIIAASTPDYIQFCESSNDPFDIGRTPPFLPNPRQYFLRKYNENYLLTNENSWKIVQKQLNKGSSLMQSACSGSSSISLSSQLPPGIRQCREKKNTVALLRWIDEKVGTGKIHCLFHNLRNNQSNYNIHSTSDLFTQICMKGSLEAVQYVHNKYEIAEILHLPCICTIARFSTQDTSVVRWMIKEIYLHKQQQEQTHSTTFFQREKQEKHKKLQELKMTLEKYEECTKLQIFEKRGAWFTEWQDFFREYGITP